MKALRLLIIVVMFIHSGFAQPISKTQTKPQVLIDADRMAEAFLQKDYKTFVEFTYLGLLEKAGGKESFRIRFQESILQLESQGAHHDSVIISDPSPTVFCNGELQCVLRQEMVISSSGQKPFRDITYLIAFSSDNGKSWTFLNGARRKLPDIIKEFPNICETLPLEAKYFPK